MFKLPEDIRCLKNSITKIETSIESLQKTAQSNFDRIEGAQKTQFDEIQTAISKFHSCLNIGLGTSFEHFNASWMKKYLLFQYPFKNMSVF